MEDRCWFRRHTQVGSDYRVSTVGNLYIDGKREMMGVYGYFETMVFKTLADQDPENEGCGCHLVQDWGGIETSRCDNAGAANESHDAFVEKYRHMDSE